MVSNGTGKSLFSLALGTFTLGMTEFVMMGILPDVANSLHVSIPTAGHLISTYAIGVCVGALSLIFMHKYRPKNILYLLVAFILLGTILAACSPSYWMLLCARFIGGLPHGAYFGVGSIVAVKIAREGKGTSAVAMMCAGMTVANLVGIPVDTFLSTHFSWRIPFVVAGVAALTTLYCIHRWVPDVEALPNHGMKAQFRFLKHLDPWLILAATMLGNGGIFCWYSYVSPLLQHDSGFSSYAVSILMVVAGLGMVLGNLVSGKISEYIKPGLVASVVQFVAAIALFMIVLFAQVSWLSVGLMFIVCACLFAVSSPQQFLILKHASGGEMLGGCCIQAAFNMGNAFGAFAGGIPLSLGLTYNYTALVGVPLAVIGGICLLVFHKKYE